MKPQDPRLAEELETSTERVHRRGKFIYLAIIGSSLGAVIILDAVRQRFLLDLNIWFLGLAVPIWFVIHLWRKPRCVGSGNRRSEPENSDHPDKEKAFRP